MQTLLRFWGTALLLCLTVFFAVLTLAVVSKTWFSPDSSIGKDRVAVIDLKGVIYKSGGFTHRMTELLEDPKVKAIVVRINSPGGLVGPSQEIFQSIKKANEKIPVIASIGSVGASGGYYAAVAGRKIFANPGSLTASIGVISEFANLERLYDWAKVERFTLKAGKLKDAGTETRKMTPEEREFLNNLLQDIHREFKATVKQQRSLSDSEIEKWTDGRVMTGSQAKAARLVDELGGLNEALQEAKKSAGLPEKAPVEYPEVQRKNLLRDLLFDGANEEAEEASSSLMGWAKVFLQNSPAQTRGWKILLLAPIQY